MWSSGEPPLVSRYRSGDISRGEDSYSDVLIRIKPWMSTLFSSSLNYFKLSDRCFQCDPWSSAGWDQKAMNEPERWFSELTAWSTSLVVIQPELLPSQNSFQLQKPSFGKLCCFISFIENVLFLACKCDADWDRCIRCEWLIIIYHH